VRDIERWLERLGKLVVDDWRDQPLEKINNHEYWAAWAVMAAAVALDRRDWFDWAIQQYKVAARQVDAEGYLPNELKRDTRALSYHNYSLGPLAMIAAFAKANGVDLQKENNGALDRLARRVLAGVENPGQFEAKTGKKQELEELQEASKFAWMEPYCWLNRCDGAVARRVVGLRPIKAYRLGGNLTELFAHPS
jgi:poly(beta-D-mannuronate) lyase